jgi:hypothetical protein
MKALCSHAKHYKENFHMVVLCSISIQLHKEYFGAPLADFNEASTIWWYFLIYTSRKENHEEVWAKQILISLHV